MSFEEEPDEALFAPFEFDEEIAWSQPPEEPSDPVCLPVALRSTSTSMCETPAAEKTPCRPLEETPEKVVQSKWTRISCKRPRRESDSVGAAPEVSKHTPSSAKVLGWDEVVADMQKQEYAYDAADTVPLQESVE